VDAIDWIGWPVGYQVAVQADGQSLLAGLRLSLRGEPQPGLVRFRGGDMLALRGIEPRASGEWRLRLNLPTGQTGIVESSTNLTDCNAITLPVDAESFDFVAPTGERQRRNP